MRFSKSEMKKASKIIRNSIKNGKGLPSQVKMEDMDSKKPHILSKKQYNGLFEAQNIFIRNHGRYPNYVTLNSTANNPLVIDYQDNAYTCGPTSISMACQMLYDYHSETECAKVLGTVKGSGTDPSSIIRNAGKLDLKVSQINRSFTAVKQSLSKGYPVLMHIQTKPATCLGYSGDYGHYILCYDVNAVGGEYKVADPTKGLKKCRAIILDKATNGRSIHYYSVKPI